MPLTMYCRSHGVTPHRLWFSGLPQGQGALRPILPYLPYLRVHQLKLLALKVGGSRSGAGR